MKSTPLKFKNVIVKTPCQNMVNDIREASLGAPDYQLALLQHQNYITTLQQCDVKVTVLPADEAVPDSCFVEDPALITPQCAIITNPGASSRKGETSAIELAVSEFYSEREHIVSSGTLDGGLSCLSLRF